METVMDWLPSVGIACGGALGFWLGPRAFTFLRAIASGWNKENVKDRLAICKVCPRVKERDYVDPDGGLTSFLFCDECKCGSHHIAELNTKLGFNNLACPMGKWGPASAMTVHEGHDLLISRGAKERAIDMRERTNIMAGRDRNDNGPLVNQPSGPVQLGTNGPQPGGRTAQEQVEAQLQPSREAAQAQRAKIRKARKETIEQQRQSRETSNAAKHAGRTNKIWGDNQPAATTTSYEDTNSAAPLVGTDHEDEILVDQKEQDDGGHSLDQRNGR